MTQADLSIVPAPGTKNYDAMTTAELQDAAYRWVLDYNQNKGHLPTQAEVGDQFNKSRGWGRDRIKEMRMRGLIADDGSGDTVDTVAELTADLERAEQAREQAVNAQRAAEADATRTQEWANQTVAEARAAADRRVAELEGATTERIKGTELQSTAAAQRLNAEHEQQLQELQEQAESRVQQIRSDAEQRIAAAIASAPSVRRAAEDQEAAEVLASTVTEKHHRTLQNLMYGFYAVAAAAALTGQVWAGVEHIPFPDSWPVWAKALAVAPAFAVLEFGGVVTAAAADLRRRLGERATGFRIMSFAAATVAAGFNLVGHWGNWTPAIGFTGLSVFAYLLWLLYSEARRRDVLRNAGMMSRPAPVYGIGQWLREFRLTALARRLAVEHGYGMHESLRIVREEKRAAAERQAEEDLRAKRRAAIAATIERRVREEAGDEIGADIAVTTIPLDLVADEVTRRVDVGLWGDLIEQDIRPSRKTQSAEIA